jgi:hypothetical protein
MSWRCSPRGRSRRSTHFSEGLGSACRTLDDGERERFIAVQRQANRWTYIGSGMSHPKFLKTLGQVSAEGRRLIEEATPAFL